MDMISNLVDTAQHQKPDCFSELYFGEVELQRVLLAFCPAKDVNRLDDLGDRAINSAVMAGHGQVVT